MSGDDWTVVAAVGGLVLGMVSLGLQLLGPWWRGRSASFEVRAEIHNYVSPVNGPQQQRRIILVNRGSGLARKVTVTALDEAGEPLAPVDYFGQDAHTIFPGQTRHVVYAGRLVTSDLRGVDLAWTDGRGPHEQRHSVIAIYT